MELNFFQLLIMGLAVFRMTHLIVFDKITEFLRAPFFDEEKEISESGEEEIYLIPKKGGWKGFIAELISCYWCTGIWVTVGLYIGYSWIPIIAGPFITILAVAGVAAILESVVQHLISE
ncbi:DUF1360 domain-containing protein [Bacillus seohaeanensis]|uniref:DUF1360 domain-containing protein n=1 Tax=Bacillus seohaeanensis TaxID=284580 RepID=A0ABW5RNI8_9BACI